MKTNLFLSLILFNSAVYAADPQYSISPLPSGPLNIEFARVNDINDSGQIVGSFKTEGESSHAFISSEVNGNRVMTGLGQLINSISSEAFSINNSGQVVGSFTIDDPRPELGQGAFLSHSFIATKTNNGWVMTDLTPEAFRSSAHDINENGEVAGNIGVEGESKQNVFVGIANENGWNVTSTANRKSVTPIME